MYEAKSIPLSIPKIDGKEWEYIKSCLDTGWVSSRGSFVDNFEAKTARYCGTKFSVACINGTSALHISLVISGVGRNDEVIVPTVTFIAPVNIVRYVGAMPIFMDCDDYLNIDVQKTSEFIKKECRFKYGRLFNKTTGNVIKAIIPVHVFGHPVEIEGLVDLAKKYNLKIIEDATESLGSRYIAGRFANRKTGSIGDFGCLSFNANKIITSGGGGMILTNDKLAAAKAKYLTKQAKNNEAMFIHDEIGYNYRLSNLHAALGLAQLERIEDFIAIKRKNFDLYQELLAGIEGISLIAEPPSCFSNYWFYSLVIDKRKYPKDNLVLMKSFARVNIQTRPIWYLNHRQKPYRIFQAYKIEKAIKYYSQVLSLPCSVNLDTNDIKRIVEVIKKNAKK